MFEPLQSCNANLRPSGCQVIAKGRHLFFFEFRGFKPTPAKSKQDVLLILPLLLTEFGANLDIGRRFAAALLPRLPVFGTNRNSFRTWPRFYANNCWLRRPGPWPGAEAVTRIPGHTTRAPPVGLELESQWRPTASSSMPLPTWTRH